MINKIAQFIPIVAIYVLLSQYKGCILFSHTVIGKLCAIGIIIFYSILDSTIGLLVCTLVILFYQMDCTEIMLNKEAFHDIEGVTISQIISAKELPPLKYEEMNLAKSSNSNKHEAFGNYSEGYSADEIQQTFRDQNCVQGVLKYKNLPVRDEMATHIYQEVKFNDEYCNVCRPTCKFSIVESKFKSEEKIALAGSS